MIYHLEPLIPFREIDTTDIHDAFKLALRVVSEECENGDDTRRADV